MSINKEPTVIPFNSQINNLVGQILTIIDASYPSGDQKEAIKSLVREKIYIWADKTEARFAIKDAVLTMGQVPFTN